MYGNIPLFFQFFYLISQQRILRAWQLQAFDGPGEKPTLEWSWYVSDILSRQMLNMKPKSRDHIYIYITSSK